MIQENPITDNKSKKKINNILSSLLQEYDLNAYYRNYLLSIDQGLGLQLHGEVLGREGFSEAERCFRDPQVKACFNRIVFSVNDKKPIWQIPETSEIFSQAQIDESRKAANFLNWSFKKLKGSIKQLNYDLLTAKFFSVSFVEKVFDILLEGQWKGLYYYKRFKAKRAGLWDFHIDDKGNIDGIISLLKRYNEDGTELILSLEKFIYLQWLPLFGNTWGQGDFEAVWKFWDAKVEFIVFMLSLGSRQSKGKQYTLTSEAGSDPETNEDERDIILKNLTNGLAAYIPQGYKVDFSDFDTKALNDMISVIRILDSQIALAMIGNSTSINESMGAGTNAQSQVHKESTDIFESYAVSSLIEKYEEDYAKPLLKLNFPNLPEILYPELKFIDDIDIDLTKEVDMDIKLIDKGIADITTEADLNYYRNKYNLPENTDLLYYLQNKEEIEKDDIILDVTEDEKDLE